MPSSYAQVQFFLILDYWLNISELPISYVETCVYALCIPQSSLWGPIQILFICFFMKDKPIVIYQYRIATFMY